MEFEFNSHRDDNHVAALAIVVFLQSQVPHLKNVSTEGQEVDENQDQNQDENQDIESDDDEAQIKSICLSYYYNKVGLMSQEKI